MEPTRPRGLQMLEKGLVLVFVLLVILSLLPAAFENFSMMLAFQAGGLLLSQVLDLIRGHESEARGMRWFVAFLALTIALLFAAMLTLSFRVHKISWVHRPFEFWIAVAYLACFALGLWLAWTLRNERRWVNASGTSLTPPERESQEART